MARYYFPTGLVFAPPGEDRQAFVAANTPFTFWSESEGGVEFEDILTPNEGSPAVLVTDEDGERPAVRGPDDVKMMWCDAGSGRRYPVYSVDALQWLLENYEGPTDPTGDIDGGLL